MKPFFLKYNICLNIINNFNNNNIGQIYNNKSQQKIYTEIEDYNDGYINYKIYIPYVNIKQKENTFKDLRTEILKILRKIIDK